MSQMINWGAFSPKHKRYIKRAIRSTFSVGEGSVRAGKTIDHCIIAAAYLEKTPDVFHLAYGSTIANAKLNIGVCNGYGLEALFRGRSRWGKYRDNEALYIGTQTGEKIVIFAGGGKADSYKRILGNSYGLWIATEVNEHYDCEDSRTSFIKVAMARQAAAAWPMTLWDLNPSSPNHPIYTDYIDRYQSEGLPGYNYEHFTIFDNATLTEEQRNAFIAKYRKDSVWYRRDILGQRVVAEGIIFQQFADEPEKWIIDEVPKDVKWMTFGIDFGVNRSNTIFICNGIRQGGAGVVILDEYKMEMPGVRPDQVEKRFCEFVRRCMAKFPNIKPTYCWTDQPETLTFGIAAAIRREGLPVGVTLAQKRDILDRIYAKERMLNRGKWKVLRSCPMVIFSTANQLWNEKKALLGIDERLDADPRVNDVADAEEYSWEQFIEEMGVQE